MKHESNCLRLVVRHRLLSAIVATASMLLFGSPALASSFNGEIDEFYTGVRSLGMGGVYVNTVNDETALLTNPAGLGKLRDFTLTIADPELHGAFANTEIVNVTNFMDAISIQGLLDRLNQARGQKWHSKLQLFPSFVAPNFGVGLLGKYQINASVDPAGTVYRLDYVNDWALALGYNFRMYGGIVKVGVSGRFVNRTEIHGDLDPASTGLTVAGLAREGMGVAADAGLILTAPIAGLPALGVSVRDVGNTSYNFREGMFNATTLRPEDTEQTVDVALSFQPILGNRTRTTIAFEYHGVTTPLVEDQEDVIKRSHAGIEFNFADFAFVRAGANQGYWTAGLEFATEKFQLQVASYGEEIGNPNGRREDRRWVGKFALRF
jgi:hypothetical protein